MSHRFVPLVVSCAVIVLLEPAASVAEPKKASEAQIQASINRAVGHLRPLAANQDGGEGALITMALLKSGLTTEVPEIQRGVDRILARIDKDEYKPGNHHVYEAGVSLMALANADPKKYKPQIEAIAKYLISAQQPGGEWDYPNPGYGDTSISQYAILGLWEAVRSGVTVPRRVWDKAAGWHVTRSGTAARTAAVGQSAVDQHDHKDSGDC